MRGDSPIGIWMPVEGGNLVAGFRCCDSVRPSTVNGAAEFWIGYRA